MKSKLTCPSCRNRLEMETHPAKSTKNPQPYVTIWCGVGRCPSTAANDGGSGPTEQDAYVSLLAAVDTETEKECEPWQNESDEDRKERIEDQKAERKSDR